MPSVSELKATWLSFRELTMDTGETTSAQDDLVSRLPEHHLGERTQVHLTSQARHPWPRRHDLHNRTVRDYGRSSSILREGFARYWTSRQWC